MLGLGAISDSAISSIFESITVVPPPFNISDMSRIVFETRPSSTKRLEVFDFESNLRAGETILSASVAVSVISGTDANPSAVISGGPTISGSKVQQMFTLGTSGVIYAAVCTAITSLSQKLQLGAYMAVVEGQ